MQRTLSPLPASRINQFSENRKRINYFLENQSLKNTIQEFFTTQTNFHKNMQKLVKAVVAVNRKLPESKRHELAEYISPYSSLQTNIFGNYTADITEDILKIASVVHPKNEEFKKLLNTVISTISNLKNFTEALKEIEKNPELIQLMKAQSNCSSWLMLTGFLDLPFQNLMRYELLLKAIQTNLQKLECKPSDQILCKIKSSIEYLEKELAKLKNKNDILLLTLSTELEIKEIKQNYLTHPTLENKTADYLDYILLGLNRITEKMKQFRDEDLNRYEHLKDPHVQSALTELKSFPDQDALRKIADCLSFVVPELISINENKEIIMLLDEIERGLRYLLAQEAQAIETTSYGVTYHQKDPRHLKDHIEYILFSILNGKEKIIQGDQNVCSLYRGLIDMLDDLKEKYNREVNTQSMFSTAYTYLASSYNFFNAIRPAQTYLSLDSMIQKLKTTLAQTEALSDILESKRKKGSGIN